MFTDIGAIFDWINGGVFNLTGEWLVPPMVPVANPAVKGFDASSAQLKGAPGTMLPIVFYPNQWSLAGLLSAGPGNTNLLTYGVWRWGATIVQVGIRPAGALAPVALTTTAGGTLPVAQNTTAVFSNGYVRHFAWAGGAPKRVIVVAPGVQVLFTQPWSALTQRWQPWLNVRVTLTRAIPPDVTLGGQLGSTLPITVDGAAFTAKQGFILAPVAAGSKAAGR